MKLKGGCLCGAVRYTATSEPAMTVVCHCAHCQKQSGSSFSVMVAVPRHSLTVNGDDLKSFEDVGESGSPVHRRFCGRCGSPILTEAEAFPAFFFIKAGTLDDTTSLSPETHIWCAHKQPWVRLDEGVARVERNPPAG